MKKLLPLFLLILLSGCSSQPDPTLIDLKLAASSNLNPDQVGRPSPMVVKLIELNAATTFENAGFFQLYNSASSTLGPDLVAEEEVIMRPGETKDLKLRINDGSKYIGVIGAYQQLDDSQWKFLHTVEIEDRQSVELAITKSSILRVKYVKSQKNKPTTPSTDNE
ncbi:type VI secretion system lipoprotein TssJ [Vibrio genomosp. F6]|uniref:Type VI secretion system-associated lipoprotein n=1 Tax=Vibrio genomosp. F6 str. FF-238 TaxID=1191298 RepID=A0A1E5CX17_9VIBR|nr:type VI secretion system lipoprotein TssJ [Vibrio genomosp. F6]OEE75057.1 type VI secretion system-associated lipoprotein [Vibrio genomosp. F6 str. FF-238]